MNLNYRMVFGGSKEKMNRISGKIVNWLIRRNAISTEERELYEYAAHCLFLFLYPIVFALVVGTFLGMVPEAVILIISFVFVRKFAGGYHANSFARCLIISSIVIISTLLIASVIDNGITLNMIYIASSVMLILFSPIDSPNKRLDCEDRAFCKKITMYIVVILIIIVESMWLKEYRYYIKFIEIGVVLAELLQITAMIKAIIYQNQQ